MENAVVVSMQRKTVNSAILTPQHALLASYLAKYKRSIVHFSYIACHQCAARTCFL
jgi:hypothetical protein